VFNVVSSVVRVVHVTLCTQNWSTTILHADVADFEVSWTNGKTP